MDEPDVTTTTDPPDGRAGRDQERRVTVAFGVVLIVVGGLFLGARQLGVDLGAIGWPAFVIVPGVALYLLAFAIGGPAGAGLAVPGAIATATGLLLAWQNATGLWATWAYAWSLVVPGGAGLGLLVYGLVTRQRDLLDAGRWMTIVGAALFCGFGLFFEGFIGLSGNRLVGFDVALPVVLVIVGGLLVVTSLVGRGRRA